MQFAAPNTFPADLCPQSFFVIKAGPDAVIGLRCDAQHRLKETQQGS